jgi:UDP-N-acetylglucosamine--N-acetylmuramyl-(pentapeptide) pyrophosphoryl-undecaprenol N-acetylglucosamine transferase
MKQNKETHRIIISGGGTGGHIYPAIAIADAIKKLEPDAEILFVGATGRMEMEKVPSAGYRIKGLPIAGLQRGYSPSALISNLALPIRLLKSIREAAEYSGILSPCSRWCRRVCQRTASVGGRSPKDTLLFTGTEWICRKNK